MLRSHQGESSDVFHSLPWLPLSEFMALLLQPPQPLLGRVMSTMKCGALSSPTEDRIVFQSEAPRGEKIFVPAGQLLRSSDLRASKQLEHLTSGPAEYGPLSVMRSHLQSGGLPGAASVEISMMPVHSFASCLPLASAGSGANSASLYSGVLG